MEWGPRALGNRSILCDPRRADMKAILNAKIKRRESFRPFAPSVLQEAVSEWFEEDDDGAVHDAGISNSGGQTATHSGGHPRRRLRSTSDSVSPHQSQVLPFGRTVPRPSLAFPCCSTLRSTKMNQWYASRRRRSTAFFEQKWTFW